MDTARVSNEIGLLVAVAFGHKSKPPALEVSIENRLLCCLSNNERSRSVHQKRVCARDFVSFDGISTCRLIQIHLKAINICGFNAE